MSRITLLVLVLVPVTGCGSADRDQAADSGARALQLLAPAEVERLAVDSPERTVFRWWREMQFKTASALNHFTPAVAREIHSGFAERLYRDFGPWLQYSRPRVIDVDRRDGTATVYVRIDQNQVVSPKIIKRNREYVAFALRRVSGRWLLSDPSFFVQNSTRLQGTRQQAERRATNR